MKAIFFALLMIPSTLAAQQGAAGILGSWQADMLEGQQAIVVNADSTVSFGEETVRIRISSDTIYVQFGEEWVGYNFVLNGETLTLSGGDLMDPVTLRRLASPSSGKSTPWESGHL